MNNTVRIKRNKNIAKMRLLNKKDTSAREILIEHFWPPDMWPDHVVNSLMEFKYTDRICVCNFFFGNGLQQEVAFKIIAFYHSWNTAAEKMYEYTFSQLWLRNQNAVNRIHDDWEQIISSYYFYSMWSRSVMFFDGSIRLNGRKINVLNNTNISNKIHIPHNVEIIKSQNGRLAVQNGTDSLRNYHEEREKRNRLERRWQFLASIDNDPIIIDGHVFKFSPTLYTNVI